MGNLLLILVILFASLFILTKVLEGRAKPLEPEQQASLSKWIMIAVFVSIILSMIKLGMDG